MSESVEVRLIAETEIAAVTELIVDAYSGTYEVDQEYRAELSKVAERASKHQVWVACDLSTGELLGTVCTPKPGEQLHAYADTNEMDFRVLAVAESARGRGIARALIAHCAALALERQAKRLMLHTGGHMSQAIGLYERLGFTRMPDIEANFPYPPGQWYDVRVFARQLAE